MADRDPSLFLFDGYNLLHASPFTEARELVDALASFVATKGARGVVVFDGTGENGERGPLSICYAPDADTLLERLAAKHRDREAVVLVSSDTTVIGTAGRQVTRVSSQAFFRDLEPTQQRDEPPAALADRLDPETRAHLERLRRGE
jgi:predicted RNA-binding protein with PIN domain